MLTKGEREGGKMRSMELKQTTLHKIDKQQGPTL